MSRAVTLRPHAKINLTLGVGPKQASGYHDVRTLLQSVAIADTLTFTPRQGPFALQCRAPGVPVDQTNLVARAASLLWRDSGREGEPRDVHVRLDKGIPAAAGLGGGSADAAAALTGLNAVWDLRRSRRDLLRLAGRLGSDVPFFLVGGTAIGLGRGDEVYPVEDVAPLGLVILKPSFGVAAADAYQWLDDDRAAGLTHGARESREIEVGWASGPIAIANDLEGPVSRRHPEVHGLLEALLREGALAASMSGSGSAVFGVFAAARVAHAARRLRRPDWLVLVTRTLGRREAVRRMGL